VLGRVAPQRTSTDLEQARLCAAGDEAARLRLFDEQRRRVHLILFRILGSNRDLDDLVQEAFVALFRSLRRYRGEASLNTWVDRITTRIAYRYLSRGAPPAVRLGLVSNQSSQDELAIDDQLHLRDIARRLYAILDGLAPKYRVTFALHVLDERSLSEVAAITEVTQVAAKARLWRARNMVERSAQADPALREYLQRLRGGRR
jgi:RNA polymerase sigma-70 factor (ECF subfamily)